MAALWIDAAGAEAGQDLALCSPSLRTWLAGDWGLLFSHPDDFQDNSLETDRWLDILRDEFRGRGVRPLACARTRPAPDRSWVSRLLSDERVLALQEPMSARALQIADEGFHADGPADVVDLPARTLRRDILSLRDRFVLIIDAGLHQFGLLRYLPGRVSISPLDLLSSVDALRRRHGGARRAAA